MKGALKYERESGQMLVGGLVFLLLASIVAVTFLVLAFRSKEHLDELAATRDPLIQEAMGTAALLNELAMNQSLLFWHAIGALRAQEEFREAFLLEGATRPYWKTPELSVRFAGKRLTLSGSLAAYRNALSLRSSRHLMAIQGLASHNAQLKEKILRRLPGLAPRIQDYPVGDVFCKAAGAWFKSPALEYPGVTQLLYVVAGDAGFRFHASDCSIRFLLRQEYLLRQEVKVSSPREQWEEFEEALKKGATQEQRTKVFTLAPPRAGDSHSSTGGEALTFRKISPQGNFQVEVVLVHPRLDTPGALFEPNWTAALKKVTLTPGSKTRRRAHDSDL